jgi:hypothetical protein
VEAPAAAGSYELEWDMVIVGIAWFSDHGVPTSAHRVDVRSDIPADATRAGRLGRLE